MPDTFQISGFAPQFLIGSCQATQLDRAGECFGVSLMGRCGRRLPIAGPFPPDLARQLAREINLRSLALQRRKQPYAN